MMLGACMSDPRVAAMNADWSVLLRIAIFVAVGYVIYRILRGRWERKEKARKAEDLNRRDWEKWNRRRKPRRRR